VVLLDVTMPGLDGDKLLPSLRASAKLQNTRFVLYSSKPVAELEKLARRCGADGYIPKTKDWTAFVAAVRRFLDSRTLPEVAKHRDGV
jgi:DNA-binding NarL/FixJ family response regulator